MERLPISPFFLLTLPFHINFYTTDSMSTIYATVSSALCLWLEEHNDDMADSIVKYLARHETTVELKLMRRAIKKALHTAPAASSDAGKTSKVAKTPPPAKPSKSKGTCIFPSVAEGESRDIVIIMDYSPTNHVMYMGDEDHKKLSVPFNKIHERGVIGNGQIKFGPGGCLVLKEHYAEFKAMLIESGRRVTETTGEKYAKLKGISLEPKKRAIHTPDDDDQPAPKKAKVSSGDASPAKAKVTKPPPQEEESDNDDFEVPPTRPVPKSATGSLSISKHPKPSSAKPSKLKPIQEEEIEEEDIEPPKPKPLSGWPHKSTKPAPAKTSKPIPKEDSDEEIEEKPAKTMKPKSKLQPKDDSDEEEVEEKKPVKPKSKPAPKDADASDEEVQPAKPAAAIKVHRNNWGNYEDNGYVITNLQINGRFQQIVVGIQDADADPKIYSELDSVLNLDREAYEDCKKNHRRVLTKKIIDSLLDRKLAKKLESLLPDIGEEPEEKAPKSKPAPKPVIDLEEEEEEEEVAPVRVPKGARRMAEKAVEWNSKVKNPMYMK